MIDLNFEKYKEFALKPLKIVREEQIQYWNHYVIQFETNDLPDDLVEPEALLIVNQDKEVLQVVLLEEGCDCANYQFTENEKKQLINWFQNQNL
ncbi:hypothetical protein [Alkalihalobacillus sp. 1P02AB]|uniref:hypothetical protein n=1 Tax=Alkalihalobacillus sp. 1P02AB TaxID=3132260 RepID=UPI0039A70A8E